MKIRNSLIALGAVALATIALNVSASSGTLLSPRAAGNEIIHTPAKNSDVNLVALGLTPAEYAAPRLAGSQVVKVSGANTAVNPSTRCTANMTAPPKVVQSCAANPSGPMPCCNMAAK